GKFFANAARTSPGKTGCRPPQALVATPGGAHPNSTSKALAAGSGGLSRQYVANGSHSIRQCRSSLTEGRNQISDRMLEEYSGLEDAPPEYWIDGRQPRPLRRRQSGKGRAVPVRCP